MLKTIRSAIAMASVCAPFGMAPTAQAQPGPYPGYDYGYGTHMWQQTTPAQQRQMWGNMHRWGYGPGMMGGYGPGWGMGPGMMGGFGPGYGMGPGMMGGLAGLNLSDAQAAQIDKIHDNLREKHRSLMPQIWQEQARLAGLYGAEKRDPAAIGKSHDRVSRLQREGLEARIEAENKITDILTKEQKDKFRRGRGWGMMGY